MEVTEALVRHVARLARLELTDAEVSAMREKLARVLAHVEAISRVEVGDASAAADARDAVPVSSLRPDEPRPGLTREEALANAPATDGVFFLVPKVLEGD
jgi:aspartyl-tRNA(Asn)/glutamyl-tRNA(Gln) amidotransferase subunit C